MWWKLGCSITADVTDIYPWWSLLERECSKLWDVLLEQCILLWVWDFSLEQKTILHVEDLITHYFIFHLFLDDSNQWLRCWVLPHWLGMPWVIPKEAYLYPSWWHRCEWNEDTIDHLNASIVWSRTSCFLTQTKKTHQPSGKTLRATLILGCFQYSVPSGWIGWRASLTLFYVYISLALASVSSNSSTEEPVILTNAYE